MSSRTEIPRAGPPKNRALYVLGLSAAGAVGYYFYTAGGDPNVARKAVEHDATRSLSSIRGEVPGKEKESKKSAEETMARVGSTVDRNAEEYKQRIFHNLDDSKEKTKQAVLGRIDDADRRIEQETDKAKGGIKSWFGK